MSDADPEALEAPESVCWTVHPAARSPARAALVAGLILGVSALTAQLADTPGFGWLALAFLAASLRAFFLPRRYRVDAEGAEEAGPLCATRRLPWARVKQVVPARFGVWLGERLHPSRLLPARGIFLRTQGNRAEVLAAVERAVATQRAELADGVPTDAPTEVPTKAPTDAEARVA